MNLASALKNQLYLFSSLSVLLTAAMGIITWLLLVDFGRFSYTLPLLFYGASFQIVDGAYLYGLYLRRSWAYPGGFLLIIAGFILSLAWHAFFKRKILPSILFLSHSTLNIIAILNVFVISAVLLCLCLAFSQQIRLRRILKG